MYEAVGKIYRTSDYNAFRKLDGNRSVKDGRVEKIKKSLEQVGYVRSPIIVNEKMEVIDGQGRLEAFEQKHLPVEFIIAEGAGLNECIALNINQTNWTLEDYIASWVEQGNTSYLYLQLLLQEFGKSLSFNAIMNAINDSMNSAAPKVKEGFFECDQAAYEEARRVLAYENELLPYLSKVTGSKIYYLLAVSFCFKHCKEVDLGRLKKQIQSYYPTMIPGANIKVAMEELERVYNRGLQKKVFIYNHYQRFMSYQYAHYPTRYMKKK